MAQPAKQRRQSSIDELIAKHMDAIKKLEERKVRKNKRNMAKKHSVIGAAFARAEREGIVANTLFTQVVSRFSKPEDLDLVSESFPLDESNLQAYEPPKRGRNPEKNGALTSKKATASKPKVAESSQPGLANTIPPTEEPRVAGQESDETPENKDVVARVEKTEDKLGKVHVTRKRRTTAKMDKPETTPKAEKAQSTPPKAEDKKGKAADGDDQDFTAPPLDEEEDTDTSGFNTSGSGGETQVPESSAHDDDMDEEDHDPIPSNVIDTRLALDDIDQFASRMRTVQRLNSVGIFTIGDVITKTESEFSRLRGMNESTIKPVKAILSEMKLSFKKEAA